MNDHPDDLEFDPTSGGDDASDPDTNLILDYLSNKLDPEDVQRLEDRARKDKEFRYKLADIVLLKGLVMLALEKNPGPAARECRRTQRLFLDYLKGKTSVKKTAQLSRHLEDCFECELAFERFQERPAAVRDDRPGWRGFWRRLVRPRQLAVAAMVAVALAAGAFGVVGFLSSAGRPTSHVAPAAREAAQPDGLVLRPGEVLSALAQVTAAHPDLDANKLSDIVNEILDGTRNPLERSDRYVTLGKDFGSSAERLLWVLAANEPLGDARRTIYTVLETLPASDTDALIAAARREVEARNDQVFRLVQMLAARMTPEVQEYLRSLFAEGQRNDEWRMQMFCQVYRQMKQDPVIANRMTALLADPNQVIRSYAVLAGSYAKDDAVLPVAIGLLQSNDPKAQRNAALVIARRGTQEQVDQLLAQPWARRADIKSAIDGVLKSRKEITLPQNP